MYLYRRRDAYPTIRESRTAKPVSFFSTLVKSRLRRGRGQNIYAAWKRKRSRERGRKVSVEDDYEKAGMICSPTFASSHANEE